MTRADVNSWQNEAFCTKTTKTDEINVVFHHVNKEILESRIYPDFEFNTLYSLEDGEWEIVAHQEQSASKRKIAFVKDDKVVCIPDDNTDDKVGCISDNHMNMTVKVMSLGK